MAKADRFPSRAVNGTEKSRDDGGSMLAKADIPNICWKIEVLGGPRFVSGAIREPEAPSSAEDCTSSPKSKTLHDSVIPTRLKFVDGDAGVGYHITFENRKGIVWVL